jgi:hypothetical protein
MGQVINCLSGKCKVLNSKSSRAETSFSLSFISPSPFLFSPFWVLPQIHGFIYSMQYVISRLEEWFTWKSTCLVTMRLWVQNPEPPENICYSLLPSLLFLILKSLQIQLVWGPSSQFMHLFKIFLPIFYHFFIFWQKVMSLPWISHFSRVSSYWSKIGSTENVVQWHSTHWTWLMPWVLSPGQG